MHRFQFCGCWRAWALLYFHPILNNSKYELDQRILHPDCLRLDVCHTKTFMYCDMNLQPSIFDAPTNWQLTYCIPSTQRWPKYKKKTQYPKSHSLQVAGILQIMLNGMSDISCIMWATGSSAWSLIMMHILQHVLKGPSVKQKAAGLNSRLILGLKHLSWLNFIWHQCSFQFIVASWSRRLQTDGEITDMPVCIALNLS